MTVSAWTLVLSSKKVHPYSIQFHVDFIYLPHDDSYSNTRRATCACGTPLVARRFIEIVSSVYGISFACSYGGYTCAHE